MATPADVLRWTGLEISPADCTFFDAAAETQLDADGGMAIAGTMRTQLICYLIASRIACRGPSAQKQSETLGDYSYSRRSSTGSSVWYDWYRELLDSLTAADGMPTETNGGIVERTVDTDLIALHGSSSREGI
ncbi:MAG TPA: hypothetical protein O0X27_04680 [Methanocorpusculum sp.]|nr:hypothetical protein [Methanocorpusculum sp.]